MDLKDLSQNWRKLRETLKQSKSSPTPKRKAIAGDASSPNAIKRRRTLPAARDYRPNASGFQRNLRMSETSTKSAASAALWAEDNNTSVDDLPAGVSLKSTSLPKPATGTERINEGLSSDVDIGRYIAIDCEMVGIGPNPDKKSALARVSIVNFHGTQVYDSFVRPKERVTDWRTHVSGITSDLMMNARTLEAVQADVAKIMNGRVLIGHAIRNDLDALFLGHPRRDIRDTSRHKPFRALSAGNTPALKLLASELLRVEIQGGAHSSVEDARACMLLYRTDKETFETEHARRWPTRPASRWENGEERTEESITEERRPKKQKKKKKKKH